MLTVRVERHKLCQDDCLLSDGDQKRIEKYIQRYLGKKLRLIDLCLLIGTCESGLIRKFKSTYDTTPHMLIEKIRIERACALLVSSDKSISEISYSIGFSHQSRFGQVFKKYTGLTPSRFRSL